MNSFSNHSNHTGIDVPKSDIEFRSELMTIYNWPFGFLVICIVFGVVGNSVVLFVYIFHWKRCKSRIFFVTLALLNFVNSAFNMPVETYILWRPLDFDNYWLCKTCRGTSFVINNTCAILFVGIAVDRMLVVYKPLKHHLLTVRYAKLCCGACLFGGVASGWPGFVLYGTATAHETMDGVNVTGKTCYLSDELMSGLKWPTIYVIVLLVLTVIVFLVTIVMYFLIGRKLYRVTKANSIGRKPQCTINKIAQTVNFRAFTSSASDQNSERAPRAKPEGFELKTQRKSPISKSRQDFNPYIRRVSGNNFKASRDNTMTLLLITATFILAYVPYIAIAMFRYMHEDYYEHMIKSERIAYHVFLRFYFLNSTISPFIFCFSNRRFRAKLVYLFWQKWRTRCS